jgi:hypothetical protein
MQNDDARTPAAHRSNPSDYTAGRLEINLALEIAGQVASGLDAVHKRRLVHRDIKPSNIMVNIDQRSIATVKIIDLGLAKPTGVTPAAAAISDPGAFAGTPRFASPEQFAGVSVDIRSDLYSLGVTLWVMLAGNTPFQGAPAEIMRRQRDAPLPLAQLSGIPKPVVVLLEKLLKKDPAQRFQKPSDLLRTLAKISEAIEFARISSETLGARPRPSAATLATYRKSPPAPRPQISIARLPVTGRDVFGREEDIAFLDRAWAEKNVNIVTIVAWAGVGKSTVANHWLRRMAANQYRSAELIFGWSFYRQGSSGGTSTADEFLDAALTWFGDPDARVGTPWEKGERLAKLISHRNTLLILDGLEPLQYPPGSQEGRVREPSLQALLRELAAFNKGLCVITTRLPVADIADYEGSSAQRRELEQLSTRHNFVLWLATGEIYRGWARSLSGNTAEGISWIEQGIKDFRATGAVLTVPFYLALKADALYQAGRMAEALVAINEADALSEVFEQRFYCAELRRLRGVVLAAMHSGEAEIEASFCEAMTIAQEQKSVSLAKRVQASYEEYRRTHASPFPVPNLIACFQGSRKDREM